jgi:hypothetical protein
MKEASLGGLLFPHFLHLSPRALGLQVLDEDALLILERVVRHHFLKRVVRPLFNLFGRFPELDGESYEVAPVAVEEEFFATSATFGDWYFASAAK